MEVVQSQRDFSRCPRCGRPTAPAISYLGTPSEFWKECVSCNTFINTYIPQEHQEALHRDPHLLVGNFRRIWVWKNTNI